MQQEPSEKLYAILILRSTTYILVLTSCDYLPVYTSSFLAAI
jgi:hypothetical protein